MRDGKLGIALVGLGSYSTNELAPALQKTSHCYLAGVVSGSAQKCEKYRVKYNLKDKGLYNYENFDSVRDNEDIDIVYVVLPNDLHADFVVRAARAGKHVICEKPMATTVEDCQRMIYACEQAGVMLSVGYRLHFDPYNLQMMLMGQHQMFGAIRKLVAKNGMNVGDPVQWRLNRKLAGGGPLMDLGIYCVQGVIYTLGELPLAVEAEFHKKTDIDKFNDVEEGITWTMYFPGGVAAECETSYSKEYDLLRAEGKNGSFELQPAFDYRGLKCKTSEGKIRFPEISQQAAQMDDFARCILNRRSPKVSGAMGLRDIRILLAIYEAAKTGKRVELHLEEFAGMPEM